MLRRITASREQLVMRRASNGYETQEVNASWNGHCARLMVRRVHRGEVSVELDREDLEALVRWATDLVATSGDGRPL